MSKMGQRGTWHTSGGPTMPSHQMVVWPSLAAPWHGEGPPGPPLTSPPSLHSLSRNISTPQLKPVFLLFFLAIFNLLAQPIFVAEIWSICSPVCDSFDCPIRILFSGVFLDYFSSNR
jgi:hypothetical protein